MTHVRLAAASEDVLAATRRLEAAAREKRAVCEGRPSRQGDGRNGGSSQETPQQTMKHPRWHRGVWHHWATLK